MCFVYRTNPITDQLANWGQFIAKKAKAIDLRAKNISDNTLKIAKMAPYVLASCAFIRICYVLYNDRQKFSYNSHVMMPMMTLSALKIGINYVHAIGKHSVVVMKRPNTVKKNREESCFKTIFKLFGLFMNLDEVENISCRFSR